MLEIQMLMRRLVLAFVIFCSTLSYASSDPSSFVTKKFSQASGEGEGEREGEGRVEDGVGG
ncbi:MAG: hypothetical protein LBI26_03250 [Holosporales bacterium]|nr:hypothetical protein [Holosporales bacterium]